MVRRWFLVCLVLVLCLAATQGALAEKVLRVAQGADVGTLDPQLQGKFVDMNVLINIFDTLVTRDGDMKLVPSLATAWKPVNDLTWRFTLRRGVKFTNGEDFNARAVKFTLDRLLDPATKSPIGELATVAKIEVVDDYTVDVITKEPDPLIPAKMVLFPGVMLPPKYIQEKGDKYFAAHPVGTGPFKFVEWVRDDHITLEANRNYWGGAPEIDKLIWRPIPNDADRAAALLAGDVEVITNLPPDMMKMVNQSKIAKAVSLKGLRVYYVVLDTRSGPLANKQVRQALNYAVNVPELIDTVLMNNAVQVASPVAEGMFGFDPTLKPYPYDPARAKRMLAEAGYPNGFSIDMSFPSGVYLKDRDAALAIMGQLEKVGVRCNPVNLEWGVFLANYRANKLPPMYLMGNMAWTMDGDNSVHRLFKTGEMYSRYSHPRVDQLIDLESSTTNPETRARAFKEMLPIIKEDAPWIFLYQGNEIYGLSNRVSWKPIMNVALWFGDARLK